MKLKITVPYGCKKEYEPPKDNILIELVKFPWFQIGNSVAYFYRHEIIDCRELQLCAGEQNG